MEPPLNPTLRTLLARRELRLSLVSDEVALPDGALEQPVRWVHSSDLRDPTPFLADDLMLLTTGTQFAAGDADGVREYVARLTARGVNGLGFGSGVHSQGIPPELVEACATHGLALFDVPYDVPFIAIARGHAESIAAQTYARRTWALDAQRALAIAALRPRGLESALTELAKRLGCWVGFFDASGALAHEHPRGIGSSTAVATAAEKLLQRGSAASRTVTDSERTHTLFTLGRTGHLRGVIAIAASAQDAETRAVVTSVIAMAGLSLEQNASLARGRRRLRAQVLESLLLDDPTLARRVLGSMPAGPIVVAVTRAGAAADALLEWWERLHAERGAATFASSSEAAVTLCMPAADHALLDKAAARFSIRLGVSAPQEYNTFSRAHAQAMTALRYVGPAADGGGAVRYADTVASSMLSAVTTDDARLVAASRLAPLRAHDRRADAELENSLRVWLEHDARFEPAAAALGIHRHTLRSRVAQSAALLGQDLASFPARAELWAALRIADD